ncbi:MAG: hypothetical protein K6G64_11050 [Eubacterium sp.]|nr:hypothetical protein [Eubacterium sp.]
MKKILALVLSLMMVLSLTACGGKDYTGKYNAVSVKAEGMEIKVGDDTWKTIFPDEKSIPYIELKKDDKCTFMFDSESEDGKYSVKDDKITVTIDGDDAKGTIKDNKITLNLEGAEIVFEKK